MQKVKNRWLEAIGTVAIAAVLAVAAGVFTMQAQAAAPGSTCPACKQSVEWVAFTGKEAITVTDGHLHLYLADDVTETISEQEIIRVSGVKNADKTQLTYGSVCFNLNGHTLTVDNGYLWLDNDCKDYASTLNIIGTDGGEIRYTGEQIVRQNYGTLNIYGGTYTPLDGGAFATCVTRGVTLEDADIGGSIVSLSNATNITLKGTTQVKLLDFSDASNGKLCVDSWWRGAATLRLKEGDETGSKLNPDRFYYTNLAPYGKLSLSTGESLEYRDGGIWVYGRLSLDETGNGYCFVCKDTVQWTEFDGKTAYTVNDGHMHFYLAKDVAETISAKELIRVSGTKDENKTQLTYGSVCFHLNGHTLTVNNGYFWLDNDCKDYASTLNIIGVNGGAIQYSRMEIVKQNYGFLNVYGGTYTGANGVAFANCVTRAVVLENAQISGDIVSLSNATNITLKGTTRVGTIKFSGYNSKLIISADWSGSATVIPQTGDFADGILNGERYSYTGNPTGKLKLSPDKNLTLKNEKITLSELQVDEAGNGYCPACKETVQWTVFDGAQAYTVEGQYRHFYLTGDTKYTADSADMITVKANGSACLHLNGRILAAGSAGFRVASADAALNIIGTNGEIHYSQNSLLRQNAGAVKVIGGIYNPVYGVPFVASATGVVTLQDADVRADLISGSSAAVFKLQGSTKVNKITLDDGGKAALASNWSGTATLDLDKTELTGGKVPAKFVSYTGTPSGTVKIASGETLTYKDGQLEKPDLLNLDDSGKGLCPLCNEKVTWTALDTDGMNFVGETAQHHHVYLTDNVLSTSGVELLEAHANQTVCLHLNGYDLTTGSIVHAAGGEVNIYGYGSNYTFTGEKAGGNVGIYAYSGGVLNMYGGRYQLFGTNNLINDSVMRIEDATVDTDVIMDSPSSQLTIAGDTNITGNIRFGTSALRGNLIVDQSFDGSVTVENKSGLITSKRGSFNWSTMSYTYTYTFNNGTATGDFTGDLKVSNGQRMINNSGTLKGALVADPLSWKKLDAMPVANSQMTEEELRQLCVDFFRTTLSFAWTPKANAQYQNKDTSPVLKFNTGKVYGGTPYVTATTGTVYTAMEYYDPITGTLNISGDAKETIMKFSNQCSGSAYWAWNRVCTSIKYTDTSTTLLGYNCLRVGPYTYPDNWTRWDQDSNSTTLVCQSNGEQTMYESYAQTKPADGLLTVRPNAEDLPANGHNRMISTYPVVVRNADGTINGEKSYLYYIDQDGEFSSDKQADGTDYTRIGVDTKFTFADIYNEGYIPFTFAELVGQKPVDESVTTMSYTGKTATVAQLSEATVTSNYSISDITIVVKDADGNQVYRNLVASNDFDRYKPGHTQVDVSVAVDADTLATYTDGKHTVEVSARIGTGEKPVVYEGLLCVTGFAKITDTETIWYDSATEAIGSYTAADFKVGNYIRLYKDASVSLASEDSYYIDGAGYNVQVTGGGILYAMDSVNAESFVCSGQWNVAQSVEIIRDFVAPDGTRYLVTTDAEGVTAPHALVLELAGVTVNTEKAGLSYEAQYKCDDSLAEMISVYGIIVSLKDMPGAVLEAGDACTKLHTFLPNDNHEVLSDSSYVYGIFKQQRAIQANALAGKNKIYANPYIQLDVDGDGADDVLVGDTENVGQQAGNAWSLYDVLKTIDDNWTANAYQQAAVNAFYGTWKDRGMSQYDFTNIA